LRIDGRLACLYHSLASLEFSIHDNVMYSSVLIPGLGKLGREGGK
jgi:hypothetical protein